MNMNMNVTGRRKMGPRLPAESSLESLVGDQIQGYQVARPVQEPRNIKSSLRSTKDRSENT